MKQLYQYKRSYDRDLEKNYMVLTTNVENFNEGNYQVQMLMNNQIAHLLPVTLRGQNDAISLYYDITSKQPLQELIERKEITYYQIKKIFEKLIIAVTDSRKYLLHEDQLIFDKGTIYVEPSTWEPYFCYLPEVQHPKPLAQQMKELVDYLMTKVDQKDKEGILLIHQLYTRLREKYMTFNELKALLKEEVTEEPIEPYGSSYDTSKEKLLIKEKSEKKETVFNPVTPKSNKISKMPIKREKVVEEQEIKVTPVKYKVLAGVLQIIVVVLMLLVIRLKVFVNDITGQIDITKVMAFFAILIALDLYGVLKMFHPSNKEIKIVEVEKTMPIHPDSRYDFINMDKTTIRNDEPEEEPLTKITQEKDNTYEGTTLLVEEEVGTTLLVEEDTYPQKAYLVFEEDPLGERIIIHRTPFIIGKMEGQVDYRLDHSTVSRLHAKIIKTHKDYSIVDLNSRNGTYVNEEPLTGQKPKVLKDQDVIKLSNIRLRFHIEG